MCFCCVVCVLCVCVICPCRLKVKETFPNTFAIIAHIVDRVLTSEWRSVAKRADPIVWMTSRRSLCALLMPATAITSIIDAGPRWRDEAEKSMCECIDSGSTLSERLFSGCVIAVVEHRLAKHMNDAVAKLCAFRPAFGNLLCDINVDDIRSTALAQAAEIQGASADDDVVEVVVVHLVSSSRY